MTYPPSSGPHMPAPPPLPGQPYPPGAPARPPAKPGNPIPWIVGGVVAVVLICCGGFVAIGIFADPTPPDQDSPAQVVAAPSATPAAPLTTALVPTATAAAAIATAKPTPTKPPTAVMPKLVGLNAAVAIDKLEKLGFPQENIRLGTQDENDTWVLLPENWTVTKQSEKPGARVALDSVIALTCTKQR